MKFNGPRQTLSGFAPAGRLDIDSTGLMVFSKSGIISKKLVSEHSIEKEYLVRVVPFNNTYDLEQDLSKVIDLSFLMKEGNTLEGLREGYRRDIMKPFIEAKWINESQIRFVLKEGKKRQIRRTCKELLGLKVTALKRTRIGSIRLGSLPLGKWRPLQQREIKSLLGYVKASGKSKSYR